jgi:hypothetical protein
MISWSEPFDDVKSTWWTYWSLRIRYIIPRWLFWPILPVATFILIVINHQINHNYGLSTNYALPSLPILLFLWGYTISRCLSVTVQGVKSRELRKKRGAARLTQ